jgi:hypothetical protein
VRQAPSLKELSRFEDFAHFLELLKLTTCLFEFFFLLSHGVSQFVDLFENYFHRRFLFPGLPC